MCVCGGLSGQAGFSTCSNKMFFTCPVSKWEIYLSARVADFIVF